MPLADAERDRAGEEGAADGDQPAGARVGAAQPRGDDQRRCRRPARSRAASRPGRRGVVEQPQRPGRAAEDAATAVRRAPRGPAGLAVEPAEAVVAEDQRPDAVVARARDPGTVGGRRERDEQRPGASPPRPSRRRRRAAGAAAASRPRGATHSQAAAIAGHHQQRHGHLRLEAEPDARRPRARASACARPRAPRTTNHSAATEHSTSSASGLLWREIATVIGVSGEHEAGRRSPRTRPKRRRVRS